MEQDTTFLDLPANFTLRILQAFPDEPENILNFASTCTAALAISRDEALWRHFVCAAPEFAACTDPTIWAAASYKHLWLGLVLPYRRLLGRLWHSCTWPSGQMVFVDVEAPRLVGRSLHYRSLNGPPLCHDIFVVQFPCGSEPGAAPALGKARVTCWRDKHSAHSFEAPAELRAAHGGGFVLQCSGHCDSVAAETTSRRLRGRPYPEVRQHYLDQQQQQRGATDGAAAATRRASASSIAGDVPEAAAVPPPLPDVPPVPNLDFIHFITLADMLPSFKTPVFTPVSLDPWMQLPPADTGSSSNSNSNDASTAAANLLGLTGLWRGAYGSHGVEVVQLQLLQAPAGFSLLEAGGAQQQDSEAFLAAEGAAGVLLQGLADRPALQQDSDNDDSISADVAPSTPTTQQEQLQATSTSQGGAAGSRDDEQKQEPSQGSVLLVATKLTGDMNVPVGRVTFAVDVTTRSTQGAGSSMTRPANFDTDTPLQGAGTRPLVIKERYRGQAQIAFVRFQTPSTISTELVLFSDADCFGLLWGHPVQSFSLFSRVHQMPGVPDHGLQ